MKKRRRKRKSKLYTVIAFYKKHDKWPVSTSKDTKERHLGEWIRRYTYLRNHTPERLTEKETELIDKINADRNNKIREQWLDSYERLKEFIGKEQGWPSQKSSDPQEVKLANWCATQRSVRKNTPKAKLNHERIRLLEEIDFNWSSYTQRRSWQESFTLVKEFYTCNGRWPVHTKDPEESKLAKWCSKMRAYKNKIDTSVTLTNQQIKKLNELGFDWTYNKKKNGRSPEHIEKLWLERYHEFCEFTQKEKRYPQRETGNLQEKSLYSWWMRMAYLKRKGKLNDERIRFLNCIGFRWGKEK